MAAPTETGPSREAEIAASLIRMALALLDRSDELLAAARLQHAIDSIGAAGTRGDQRERAVAPTGPPGPSPLVGKA